MEGEEAMETAVLPAWLKGLPRDVYRFCCTRPAFCQLQKHKNYFHPALISNSIHNSFHYSYLFFVKEEIVSFQFLLQNQSLTRKDYI